MESLKLAHPERPKQLVIRLPSHIAKRIEKTAKELKTTQGEVVRRLIGAAMDETVKVRKWSRRTTTAT